MKKLVNAAIVISIFIGFNSSYAQFSLGADLGAQMPTSEQFKSLTNTGYGFILTGEYKIPVIPVALLLSAGYDSWAYKTITYYSMSNSGFHAETFGGISMYSFSIKAGPMLYVSIPGIGLSPYIGVDAGIMAATSTAQGAGYGSGFVYSPFLGFRYTLPSGLISLDLNARESFFNQNNDSNVLSWFGINAGVYISI